MRAGNWIGGEGQAGAMSFQLSSPGLTGRSSILGPLGVYWVTRSSRVTTV